MNIEARVAVLPERSRELRIETVGLPDPGPHQVVIRQFASGVCHSQLHQIHGPRQGPELLGHESTGLVLATGADVTHVSEGDTVLVTWVPRDAAATTRAPEAAALAVSDGQAASRNVFTWADHTIADEQYVVKVASDIARDVTAIIGCAVMTGAGAVVNTAGVSRGQSVAVFGVGGVGLSAIVGAVVAGADPIIAVDLSDEKLAFARRFGATHGINAAETDPVAAIHELTRREGERTIRRQPVSGVDFAFDCIGLKSTMEQIVPAVRSGRFGVCPGGTAVLVGVPLTAVELDAADVLMNEKRFVGSIGGSCAPDRDFPMFLDWHANGTLDLESLITARYPLEAINEATAALEEGRIAGRAILTF